MIYGSAPYWIPFRSFGHLQVSEPAYSLHPILPNSVCTSILTSKCMTADPNNLSRYSRSYAHPASPMWAGQLMLEKGIFSRLLEDLKHTAQMTLTSKECCPLTWHNSLCWAESARWKALICKKNRYQHCQPYTKQIKYTWTSIVLILLAPKVLLEDRWPVMTVHPIRIQSH